MFADTNQGTSLKLGELESLKFYIFNREDEDRWNKYSIKTFAFAETKGCIEGLTDKSTSDDMKRRESIQVLESF